MHQILPTSYFGSIFQFALIVQHKNYQVDAYEHFIKQSYRNRCEIAGANGSLKLIVPLEKWKNHCPTRDIKISHDENWQIQHWRSIESAYRTSPYFEFYEDDLKPLFFLEESHLLKYNLQVEAELKALLQIGTEQQLTTSYEASSPDWRIIIHPKNNEIIEKVDFPIYIQVFESKFGFIPNLSILDLIFNFGPNSKNYLENISLEAWQKK